MVTLQNELNRIALENSIQYFGVANLSDAADFIIDQGGNELSAYPFAVSIGIRLMDSIFEVNNFPLPIKSIFFN